MQLTQFTDYSLRVLIYLGKKQNQATVHEISTFFNVSRNHLVKVVHNLSQKGMIESYKGKAGGIRLPEKTLKLKLGEIVEVLEPNFELVECFNAETNTCPIIGICGLEKILIKAHRSFMGELNEYTLGDLIQKSAVHSAPKGIDV